MTLQSIKTEISTHMKKLIYSYIQSTSTVLSLVITVTN